MDSLLKLFIILLLIYNYCIFKKTQSIKDIYNDKNNEKQKQLIDAKKMTNFYKELLQLYIENRELFYIKGREYIMKKNGKAYNESNIITFQDKLNYLLVHESPEDKTNIVDKIQLRNYSKTLLGIDLCVPILKIYNNVNEINLEELPEKFILKCNHGSDMNIICKNKSTFNLEDAKNTLNKWMKINYGLFGFEYQYMNIKRKIFTEKYLDDDIIDYKFNCFNGEPKFIRVKRHINGINVNNFYNLNWTLLNIIFNLTDYVRDPNIKFEKPKNLEKMIYYSRLLSSEFCFCRVDFYEVNGKLYLGELTFTPANAQMNYNNEEMRIYLGNFLNISKIKKNN